MEQKDPQPPWVRDLGLLGVITWNLVIYTLIGLGLGYLAWKKLGVPQMIMAVTSIAGMTLGFLQIYRLFRKDR